MSTGMLSAAASLGMILLWDVDGGLTQIDKYLYSSEDYIKVNITVSLYCYCCLFIGLSHRKKCISK